MKSRLEPEFFHEEPSTTVARYRYQAGATTNLSIPCLSRGLTDQQERA